MSKYSQSEIEQAIEELNLNNAPLDMRAFVTMLSIKLSDDLTFCEVQTALQAVICRRTGISGEKR